MRTQNSNFSKVTFNKEPQFPAHQTSIVVAHESDVFEPPETNALPKIILSKLNTDVANIEKLAHSIGENANEAWNRIWRLKTDLFEACRKCEANVPIPKQQLDAMRREASKIDMGLKKLQTIFSKTN